MITKKGITAKNEVIRKLNTKFMEEHTSIFRDMPGVQKLDPTTKNVIIYNLDIWLKSWILPLIEEIK